MEGVRPSTENTGGRRKGITGYITFIQKFRNSNKKCYHGKFRNDSFKIFKGCPNVIRHILNCKF